MQEPNRSRGALLCFGRKMVWIGYHYGAATLLMCYLIGMLPLTLLREWFWSRKGR